MAELLSCGEWGSPVWGWFDASGVVLAHSFGVEVGVLCVKPRVRLPPPVAVPVLGLMFAEEPSGFKFPAGRNAGRERLLVLCYLYPRGAAEPLHIPAQPRGVPGPVSLDFLLHGASWGWVLTPEPIPVPRKQPGGCNQELLIATHSGNSTRSPRR